MSRVFVVTCSCCCLPLQVTARFQDGPTHSFQQGASAAGSSTGLNAGGQLSAALGTKWAHCVNLRLVLERMGSRRFIKVSAHCVDAEGVHTA